MTTKDKLSPLVTTARITGIWYLVLAITGVLGFMVFHPQIFVTGDPEKTVENLIHLESTARIRLLLEFAIVVSQALTAVWFYKLFKDINSWAAWTMGIWGMVNSVVIMVSAIAMASAIGIAHSPIQTMEDKILLIAIIQQLITNAWGIGGLFFGLWLFPMGYTVIQSKRMPIWLGRIIFLGGIGYLTSTVVRYVGIDFSLNRFLILPATVGEFWMIGYLLIFGIRHTKD
ncbi:MAG: DUF4386 domain-containing protein [Allomuricauda sp.]|jgi:hypothetical protein